MEKVAGDEMKSFQVDDNIESGRGESIPIQEQNDELERGLKPRHVNMFAIAGSLGTGIIIAMGKALRAGGPGNVLIAFVLMGAATYFVMTALAEMAVFAPHKKGFSGYATRYMDPALGFATGWNYFLKYSALLANNLTAAGLIISYWRSDINLGVWIAVFGVCIIALNFLKVVWFGEVEFWFAVAKVLVLVTLILTCFTISLGGQPSGERIGFRYWNDPGAFAKYIYGGNAGAFCGFWVCFINSAFLYIGFESVAITFGESRNPRKTIPRAIRQTGYRILVFYFGGLISVSMAIPYTSEKLLGATKSKTSAAASPFVIAIQQAGIKYLPGIINGCLLLFVFSFSNSDIYLASRTLYGLAKDGQAPKFFTRTTKHGVPYFAVIASSLFISLAFLNTTKASSVVFGYFISLTTVLGAVNWANILLSYFNFHRGLKAQGLSRGDLPWRGILQPYGAYYAAFTTFLVLVFSGWEAFVPKFDPVKFAVGYIGILIWIINILAFKYWKKTKYVTPLAMDLETDVLTVAQLDAEDVAESKTKLTFFQRIKGALWGQ